MILYAQSQYIIDYLPNLLMRAMRKSEEYG